MKHWKLVTFVLIMGTFFDPNLTFAEPTVEETQSFISKKVTFDGADCSLEFPNTCSLQVTCNLEHNNSVWVRTLDLEKIPVEWLERRKDYLDNSPRANDIIFSSKHFSRDTMNGKRSKSTGIILRGNQNGDFSQPTNAKKALAAIIHLRGLCLKKGELF